MKNILIIGVILSSVLFSVKLFAQNSHSSSKKSVNTSSYSSKNRKHIESSVFTGYFRLNEAFSHSDFEVVKLEAKAIEKIASSYKIRQLSKDIYSARSIDAARNILSKMSEEYILLAKEAKVGLYIMHCSMALNNEGVNWLSFEKEINNPYFGNQMLKCGNIVGKTNE